MSTIFTKIINKEIPSDILFENQNIIVIKDINPQAKKHFLIIPKKEIQSIDHIEDDDKHIISEMFFVARDIAKKLDVIQWYKLHFNVWEKWWQEIMHLHLHFLSDL